MENTANTGITLYVICSTVCLSLEREIDAEVAAVWFGTGLGAKRCRRCKMARNLNCIIKWWSNHCPLI